MGVLSSARRTTKHTFRSSLNKFVCITEEYKSSTQDSYFKYDEAKFAVNTKPIYGCVKSKI